jgi:hypothetical protein
LSEFISIIYFHGPNLYPDFHNGVVEPTFVTVSSLLSGPNQQVGDNDLQNGSGGWNRRRSFTAISLAEMTAIVFGLGPPNDEIKMGISELSTTEWV